MFEVKSVDAGSAAARAGIMPGDCIRSINGQPLIDYIDYVYFCAQNRLRFKVLRQGRRLTLRIRKQETDDIGLEFTQPLLGHKRVCRNKCIFCFVDQLPRGMRQSLYLKDEDWRYSLLMGSYVTLSSISSSEVRRIIRRRVSPIYISVHTVDEALRRIMLGNPGAVPIRPLLKRLARHGIRFHAQVVVCPGINDGAKLNETVRFLRRLHPAAISLAVVPVGLTAYRQGLYDIMPVNRELALQIVKEVEKWQKECLNSIGTRFVFAADELYIKAGLPLPPMESYEAFDQIENGVGLVAKFFGEARDAIEDMPNTDAQVSIVTGQDAAPFFRKFAADVHQKSGAHIDVHAAVNQTFGGGVTVSGLLAGGDICTALRGKPLGQALFIPASVLRDGKVFLDDMTLEELTAALGVRVFAVTDAYELIQRLAKN